MNYLGYISGIPHWYNFKFKITQTSVFLNFLETVSDANLNLKVHKNQCFMNDRLLCGKCQPLNAEGTTE